MPRSLPLPDRAQSFCTNTPTHPRTASFSFSRPHHSSPPQSRAAASSSNGVENGQWWQIEPLDYLHICATSFALDLRSRGSKQQRQGERKSKEGGKRSLKKGWNWIRLQARMPTREM
ncbi:Hypothetical predicted protein [Podarcis lilfordi]|uniref:Uncharacterized protein n=1 Tax=Podarcis lilfordi TaxID=74358 RepID=A0AA35LKP2_9SAUR|nr:Hypothetical predicted protein [Podarcis lilfordi]